MARLALLLPVVPLVAAVRHDKLSAEELGSPSVWPSLPDAGVLADLSDTWFGLATAAAHVEVGYANDPWVAWAERGHVAAYKSPIAGPFPEQRLRFLEEPEVEINLAAETGVKVFRLGVEWGRLVTAHPVGEHPGRVTDRQALARYKDICQMIKAKGMQVMLTLFHHSMPIWSSAFGGWLEDATKTHFLNFAMDVATELAEDVDFWVTFNEPHVYVLLSNCAGLWPPGPETDVGTQLACLKGALPFINDTSGGYTKAMHHIQAAHMQFYTWAHSAESPLRNARVGVAHNVAWNEAAAWTDHPSVLITENLFKFGFIDAIKGHLDWLGLNYYGMELIGGSGPVIVKTEEYSESGRTVHPDGLFKVLMQFHKRYPVGSPGVQFKSIIVTENGISDSTDVLRPAYIVEHLLALREAKRQGVPIEGYVHWTISDNWEWADGYCPKFGLVDVDRSTTEFRRTVRPSYNLWKDIVAAKAVTQKQRDDAWSLVHDAAVAGKTRPFCRSMKDMKSGLDMPEDRPFVVKDWRFTGLTGEDAEDQCHNTPWAAEGDDEKVVAVRPDGSCNVLQTADSAACSRVVEIVRTRRCPGAKPVKETRGAVCAGHPSAAEREGCVGLLSVCCCQVAEDGAKACGFSGRAFLWGSSCPEGLVRSDKSEC